MRQRDRPLRHKLERYVTGTVPDGRGYCGRHKLGGSPSGPMNPPKPPSCPRFPPPSGARRSGPLDLIATSTFGLEAVVARELQDLGYDAQDSAIGADPLSRPTGGHLPGQLVAADRRPRAAAAGQLRGRRFRPTLRSHPCALPWAQWLPADATFPVSGRSIKSQLSSVPACQKIVKKAIVESLKAAYAVEWFAETGPKYSVEVALLENQATLTIDTSGPGLHKRGYRRLVGKAPLKETLAAALVLLSFWKPDRPLVDPFCGTGTIPIEAALIGRNMAPGLSRTFAAEAWPAVPAALWEAARQEARQAMLPDLPLRIVGADLDDAALQLARHHAQQAGVAEQIHFQRRASPSCTASVPMAASSAIRPTASGWAGPATSRASIATCPRSSAA